MGCSFTKPTIVLSTSNTKFSISRDVQSTITRGNIVKSYAFFTCKITNTKPVDVYSLEALQAIIQNNIDYMMVSEEAITLECNFVPMKRTRYTKEDISKLLVECSRLTRIMSDCEM